MKAIFRYFASFFSAPFRIPRRRATAPMPKRRRCRNGAVSDSPPSRQRLCGRQKAAGGLRRYRPLRQGHAAGFAHHSPCGASRRFSPRVPGCRSIRAPRGALAVPLMLAVRPSGGRWRASALSAATARPRGRLRAPQPFVAPRSRAIPRSSNFASASRALWRAQARGRA